MICQHCKIQAKFNCNCSFKLCKNHLEIHRETCKIYCIKKINKLRLISTELVERIHKIDEICSEVIKKTQEITHNILNLSKQNIKKLENFKTMYIGILLKENIKDLKRELKKEIILNKVDFVNKSFIEKFYSQDFYTEIFNEKLEFKDVKETKSWLEKFHGIIVEGHRSEAKSVSITIDSKYIISVGQDKTLRLWNFQEKHQEALLHGHTSWINAVAITQNNKYAVSGGGDNLLRIWNLEERRQETALQGHTNSISSIAITYDSKHAISGSNDNSIRVWNIQEQCQEFVLRGHNPI